MRTKGKQLTKIVPIVLALALIAIPTSAYALSPYQSGYEHGMSVVPVLSFAHSLDPNSYKAGYQYGTNEWNQHNPGSGSNATNQYGNPNELYSFACPLSQPYWHSNFCKGYDAALVYQNSDQ
jgi:hypothetical protein